MDHRSMHTQSTMPVPASINAHHHILNLHSFAPVEVIKLRPQGDHTSSEHSKGLMTTVVKKYGVCVECVLLPTTAGYLLHRQKEKSNFSSAFSIVLLSE